MNLYDYISDGCMLLLIVILLIIMIKYVQYWQQLKRAYGEVGIKWPLPDQKTLNAIASEDLNKGYGLIMGSNIDALKILFMKTENPILLKPLRKIRKAILWFFLSPILMAIFLVVLIFFFR